MLYMVIGENKKRWKQYAERNHKSFPFDNGFAVCIVEFFFFFFWYLLLIVFLFRGENPMIIGNAPINKRNSEQHLQLNELRVVYSLINRHDRLQNT